MSASGGRASGSSTQRFVVPGIIVLSVLILLTVIALVVALTGYFGGDDRSQAAGTGQEMENSQVGGDNGTGGEGEGGDGAATAVVDRDTVAASLGTFLDDPAAQLGSVQADYNAGGPHKYAVGDLDGDGTSDMLVRLDGDDIAPVVGVRVDPATGDLMVSQDHLVEGAAGAGGERHFLGWSGAGGVYQRDGRSMSPEATYTLFTLTGPTWTKGAVTTQTSDPADYQTVEWKSLDDRSGLDAVAVGEASSDDTAEAPDETGNDGGLPDPPPGTTRLTGTVQIMSTSEALEGMPVPNGEPESNRYAILVLNAPVTVTAPSSGGGTTTDTITRVGLASQEQYGGSLESWPQYAGQTVTIDVGPADLMFPSDASIPLGVPRLSGSPQVHSG